MKTKVMSNIDPIIFTLVLASLSDSRQCMGVCLQLAMVHNGNKKTNFNFCVYFHFYDISVCL